jgi:hypothetical protein
MLICIQWVLGQTRLQHYNCSRSGYVTNQQSKKKVDNFVVTSRIKIKSPGTTRYENCNSLCTSYTWFYQKIFQKLARTLNLGLTIINSDPLVKPGIDQFPLEENIDS